VHSSYAFHRAPPPDTRSQTIAPPILSSVSNRELARFYQIAGWGSKLNRTKIVQNCAAGCNRTYLRIKMGRWIATKKLANPAPAV
jgi:hypothetical protein